MITGNEDARELLYASPGDRNPRDYVTVQVADDGERVTVTASYTPIGHGVARVASWQYMDAQARKALPGARLVSSAETHTFGAFRLGNVSRLYSL